MNPTPKSNRREFLTGQAALKAVRGAADQAPAPETSPLAAEQPAARSYLVEITRAAMAAEFQICLNAGQYPGGPEVALRALDVVEAVEDQLTVFRAHSEVSRLNHRAAQEAVPVSPDLFRLLQQAVALSAATGGAFDITSGPLSKVWGFFRRQGRVPDEADLSEALTRVGSRYLALDAEHQTVRFLHPGLEINFHAIGKGYALDRCAELLRQQGIEHFLLHGGHSSMLAAGSRSGATDEQAGWYVALRHPLKRHVGLGEIRLRERALGTSGSGVQFFHYRGQRMGHVLDPRTGQPAEGVLSATVLAPTAAEADALATAFYVLGAERTRAYCAGHEAVAAILVCPGPHAGSLELHTIGVDDDDWRPQP